MILVGVSHLRTTHSYSGTLSLREFKEFLIERNIDFALITERSDFIEQEDGERFIKECHNLSDSQITLIPGFEVTYRDAHVLMIGTSHFVKAGSNSAENLLKWKKYAELVVWAHPHRNKYLLYDALKNVIDGIEIWNSQYDGKRAPRMKVLNSLQGLRARGANTLTYASIDFHREEQIISPNIVLEGPNKLQDIIAKLKAGEFVLKNSTVTINAKGKIIKGILPLMKFQSFYSIALISMFKNMSAFIAKLRLLVPGNLRRTTRKKL